MRHFRKYWKWQTILRDVRIRLEKPNSILMRDGWVRSLADVQSDFRLDSERENQREYQEQYPAGWADSGHANAAVSLYLSLKPDTRAASILVLRFDTLPEARIRGLEPTYGGRIPPYPTR